LQVSDFLDLKLGKRKSTNPPQRSDTINSGDPEKIGQEFLTLFKELGGLKKDDDVLDVGSGFGRMALPLTGYLSSNSRFEGIEPLARGVKWCSTKITPKFRNFRFQKLDVKNGMYNPNGKILAADYKFPFEDESFDFIILTSVFTHMLPAALENYVSEISRVLKPGGSCFITYFLLNDESTELINQGKSLYSLKYSCENYRIESQENPEYVVAYPEEVILDFYKKNGLKYQPPYYGKWCGRNEYTSFQDILIGRKNGRST